MIENLTTGITNHERFKDYSVPVDKRWKKGTGNIEFLGFGDTQLARSYREMTDIALDEEGMADPDKRFYCQSSLAGFFKQLTATSGTGKLAAFDPGASLLSCFYGRRSSQSTLDLQGGRTIMADIAVTNGTREIALIQKLGGNGSRPSEIEIHSYLIYQECAEYLVGLANQLGIPLTIKAAFPVFQIDKQGHPLRTIAEGYREGTMALGKTEELCAPLPSQFNDLAWWNRGRNST